MKRWTALLGNSAAAADGEEIYISCVLTGATIPTTNSCTEKRRRATLNFTVTERVEVEPTSIQEGG